MGDKHLNDATDSGVDVAAGAQHIAVNLTLINWTSINLSSFSSSSSSTSGPLGVIAPLWMKQFYIIFVPMLITLCLIGMTANACVLLTLRWIKGSISATLRLTVSLAVSDVYTSALLAFSFVHNSYLWAVHDMFTSACVALTAEALRTGGLLTSTFHFFVLAVNHYLSTAHPFVYKKILTPSNTNVAIILLWLFPPATLLITFASVPNEGYQSPNGTCRVHVFTETLAFRMTIFSVILTLLIAMSALYIAVILILRRMRLKFEQKSHVAAAAANNARQQQQLQRKRNTLITTLLIWGTFFVAWFPTSAIYVLSCRTCPYSPLNRYDNSGVFWVSIIAQTGILTKTLVNPIIYAVRIPEISEVLRRFSRKTCCCFNSKRKNSHGNENDGDAIDNFRSVRYRKTEDEQTVVLLVSDNNNLHKVSK